jgi:hypothetical protein
MLTSIQKYLSNLANTEKSQKKVPFKLQLLKNEKKGLPIIALSRPY